MANSFFRIEMLPARYGDCLWIEYGKGRDVYRVLIDGGPVSTFESIAKRLNAVPAGERSFELIVLTHVDADHLEGLVRLFAENPLPFAVDEVWFNGWRQMKKAHGLLGPTQGEFLSALLVRRVPRAWNPDAPPWVVPAQGALPEYCLPGGMKLTLFSPNPAKLDKMAAKWKSTIEKTGISPGNLDAAWKALASQKKFLPKKGLLGAAPNLDTLLKKQFLKDQAVPNGSSIAFLAEYEEKSALLLADAHPDLITSSLQRLCKQRGIDQLVVNAVKVGHHGSKNNTSIDELKLLKSPCYLISTNGDQFQHPDKECMARILKFGHPKRFYFNYNSKYTRPWLAKNTCQRFGYEAMVRPTNANSIQIEL